MTEREKMVEAVHAVIDQEPFIDDGSGRVLAEKIVEASGALSLAEENARLREVLAEFAKQKTQSEMRGGPAGMSSTYDSGAEHMLDQIIVIARAALDPQAVGGSDGSKSEKAE